MNRAKALRESFGRTLRDVAADTGITRSSLQRIEAEIGEPSYFAIERLADYYRVSVDYLMMHDFDAKDSILDSEAQKAVEARMEIQRLMSQLPITAGKLEKLTKEARLPKQRNDDIQKTRKGIKPRVRYKVEN